jgi:hypothetical protein
MACRNTARPAGLATVAAAALLFAATRSLPAQDGHWTRTGPNAGTVYCLAVSPGATPVLFAGTDDGVYRGERGGASWTRANSGIEGLRVQAIAIDPSHPSTLYAGTVTPLGVPSAGMFKSVDGGASWSAIDVGLVDPLTGISPVDVASIAIDPTSPSTLVVGTLFSEIFKSTDGGATWNPQTLGGANAGIVVTDVRYDPFDPTTLYAASSLGLIASVDSGDDWMFVGNAGVGFDALALDPATGGTLYGANGTGFGVGKSVDGGNTWVGANGNLAIDSAGDLPLVLAIAIDPSNPATVVIGTNGNGAFVSRDAGATWSPTGPAVLPATVDSVAFVSGSGTQPVIVLGTFGEGVFESADGGNTWTSMNAGLLAGLVPALLADPSVPGRLVAGGADGIGVSADGGETWSPSNAGLPSFPVSALARGDAGRLFAATIGGGVFASADGGASWQSSANGLSDPDIASLAADPTDAKTLYAGTTHPYDGSNPERVYKSTDGGASWRQTGLDAGGSPIGMLVVDPEKPSQVAALSPGSAGYAQSEDGGGSWSTVSASASCGSVNALFYDDARGAVLLGVSAGVCRSTDGGTSWMVISVAPLASVTAFFADPADPATLYAGAQPTVPGGTGGVFVSTDGGVTWSAVGTGLSAASVRTIARDPSGDRLYAATYGESVATLWLASPPRSPVQPAESSPPPRVISR